MAITHQQLENFNRFVEEQISRGEAELSWDEVFDLWRVDNPTEQEARENAAAVQAAIDDFHGGDRGIPLDEHIQQMREKYNLPSDK